MHHWFTDMMFLNERAMKAMLKDATNVDDDNVGEDNLLDTEERKSKKIKENPIKGKDFSLAIPRPARFENQIDSSLNLKLRRIAKQLGSFVSS